MVNTASSLKLRFAFERLSGYLFLAVVVFSSGCRILEPSSIVPTRKNLSRDLIPDGEAQIERGQPRPFIDGFGWIWGIPSKIILWDRRIEKHSISPETENLLAGYLDENGLNDVKVRLNQYHPRDDWRRLVRNKSVAWPWRYSLGTLATLGETVLPGRLFGGDHYNPYTATIHLYSDVPAIAFHEAAHAKDFSARRYPGTYAAAYALPFVPLWHEREATNDVLAYVQEKATLDPKFVLLNREAHHVLYPAYGTYLGSAGGTLAPVYSTPLYAAAVIAGHVNGRTRAPE